MLLIQYNNKASCIFLRSRTTANIVIYILTTDEILRICLILNLKYTCTFIFLFACIYYFILCTNIYIDYIVFALYLI